MVGEQDDTGKMDSHRNRAAARADIKVSLKIEEALAAAAMALICIISFANVILRYATDFSFAFTEEYSVFLLVFMTFVGASLAFATNEHTCVMLLTQRLGPVWRRVCELGSLAATLTLFILVFYYGAVLVYDQWLYEETSPGLGHPSWIYTMWLPVLSVVILLRVLGRAIRAFRATP
jgi:TRAP-type C4-dicarboxylate transport system permease small subunit